MKFIIILAILILAIIIVVIVVKRKDVKKSKIEKYEKFRENYPEYKWIGTAPTCNPVPEDCPSGYRYLTNNKYPSYAVDPNPPGTDCTISGVGYGYHALCTNAIYPNLADWMYINRNKTDNIRTDRALGNTPLNEIFLPGSHDTMTYGMNQATVAWGDLRFGPDCPFGKILDIINYLLTYIPGVNGIISSILQKWARAQQVNVLDQLNDGIRCLDMRMCVDNNNGNNKNPGPSDIKFTHSLIIDVTLAQAIDQISEFHKHHPNEIIIIDFQYLLNFCTTNIRLANYVDPLTQINLQIYVLDYIQNAFGSSLAPADIPMTTTYNNFLKNGYSIIVMFDSTGAGGECVNVPDGEECSKNNIVPNIDEINPNEFTFSDFWVEKYPWVRNRRKDISKTFANDYSEISDPRGSYNEAVYCINDSGNPKSPEDCYGNFDDPNKLVVFGATVGMTTSGTLEQIVCGDFCAVPGACSAAIAFEKKKSDIGASINCLSSINYGRSLLDQAVNFAPALLNPMLDYWGYMYKDGYFVDPIPLPPSTGRHNIFLYDDVREMNISSIIVGANIGELEKYSGNPFIPKRPLPMQNRSFRIMDINNNQYLGISTPLHVGCKGTAGFLSIVPTSNISESAYFRMIDTEDNFGTLQIFIGNWTDIMMDNCDQSSTLNSSFTFLTIKSGCKMRAKWVSNTDGYSIHAVDVSIGCGDGVGNGPIYRQGITYTEVFPPSTTQFTLYGNGWNKQGSAVQFNFEYGDPLPPPEENKPFIIRDNSQYLALRPIGNDEGCQSNQALKPVDNSYQATFFRTINNSGYTNTLQAMFNNDWIDLGITTCNQSCLGYGDKFNFISPGSGLKIEWASTGSSYMCNIVGGGSIARAGQTTACHTGLFTVYGNGSFGKGTTSLLSIEYRNPILQIIEGAPFRLIDVINGNYIGMITIKESDTGCHNNVGMAPISSDTYFTFRFIETSGYSGKLQANYNNQWIDLGITECDPGIGDKTFEYITSEGNGLRLNMTPNGLNFTAIINGSGRPLTRNGQTYRKIYKYTVYGNNRNGQGAQALLTLRYN